MTAGPVPEPFTMVTAFLAVGIFGMHMPRRERKAQEPGKT